MAAEAIDYDDGFAKILHCNQPVSADAAVDDGRLVPATDAGVQIGWDDEQVTIWYNRQLDIARDRQNNTNNEANIGKLKRPTHTPRFKFKQKIASINPILGNRREEHS